ncbi:hypothetical protein ACFE04_006693 [Oxalis oulophora]
MGLRLAAAAIYAASRTSFSLEFHSIKLTTTTSTRVWFSSQPELADDNITPLVAAAAAQNKKAILDSKTMKAVSRVCQIDSAGKLHPQTLYLIHELGMELDQIKIMARKFPNFSYCTLEGKIRPTVEFLLHIGVPKSNIRTILSKRPHLCGCSLSANLIPTMAFLEGLGVDKTQWPKVIHRSPWLLIHSRQKIQSTVDFLTEMGLLEHNIGKIITRFPNIISYSVEDKLRPTAEYLRSLGVDIALLLYQSPSVFGLSIESNLKPVSEFFLDKGFSIEEFETMVSRFGNLYSYSLVKSMIPKWEFFLTMDYQKSELVKLPQYFSYSLEERIKPRYALLKESGVKLPLSQVLTTSHSNFNKTANMLPHGRSDGTYLPRPVDATVFLSFKLQTCVELLWLGSSWFFSSQSKLADDDDADMTTLEAAENNKKATLHSKKLKAVSRLCQIGPTETLPPQTLYLIQHLGMQLHHIKLIARKHPYFAYLTLDSKIRPTVDFLFHLGVSKSNIHSIISRTPQLCGLSLSNNLIPTMTFLEGLGLDKMKWPKVIYHSPVLLTLSRHKIQSTVDFLTEMGISEQKIGKILTKYPNILLYSVENNLRPTAEYFRSLGVDIAMLLYQAPSVFGLSIDSNLKCVTNFFLDKGFSIQEIGTMVSRFSPLYNLGLVQSLIPKWEFFLTLDYPRSELVKVPSYFGYSLEKRIKPRYALVKESVAKLPLSLVLFTSRSKFEKALKTKIAKMRPNEDSKVPQLCGYSLSENFIPTMTFLEGLGVDKTQWLKSPSVFVLSIESNPKPVTEVFLKKGLTVEEIGTMVSRFEPLFCYGLVQILISKWEFFLTMDYPKSELVKFPRYFGYNLEETIKPRYAFVKESGVKQLSLARVLALSYCDFEKLLKKKITKMHSNVASK